MHQKSDQTIWCRYPSLWVSSVDYEADVRVSMDILSQVAEVYRKIRNTMRFLLANTEDFDPKKILFRTMIYVL